MTERTKPSNDHFLLIEDFRLSLQKSHFRVDRVEDSQEMINIERGMQLALSRCVKTLQIVQVADVWNNIRTHIDRRAAFVVSLDGDFIVRDPDISIEITRAARTPKEAESGRFIRIPRAIGTGILNQVKRIHHIYARQEKKKIVIFDDGLGTGKTMQRIVELLRAESMEPERIVVLANPHQFTEIDGVPVSSVFSVPSESIWLNERDLYWGLPRSGLSLIPKGQNVGLGGIPYTSSERLIEDRIGLTSKHSQSFMKDALAINARFWEAIDHTHARNYRFVDCPRLAVFAEATGIDAQLAISKYLKSIL